MAKRKILARALTALGLVTTTLVATTETPVSAGPGEPGPIFLADFDADTIGPGGVSTLTFTIDNTANGPREQLAFTDTLPAGVSIATPAHASTTCTQMRNGSGPTLSAPAGGSTISFSEAAIGGGSTCTVTVDVTSSTVGTHTNTTSVLTSTGDAATAASADLHVVASLPGFTQAFSPSTVPIGDRSTLTLTIDNSANGSVVANLDFTDSLPLGVEIADPANASTTCGTAVIPALLTASPGGTSIVLDANGTSAFPAVAAGASCAVVVDVVATAGGTLVNSVDLQADFVDAGTATAALTVTTTTLGLRQEFTNDPVLPGGSVDLEFTIVNTDRRNGVTGIGFDDALPAGVLFASETSNSCGGSLVGVGTSTITFANGTVAAGASCTIIVSLDVPAGTASGAYVNATNAITGSGGAVGNAASDTLFVATAPQLAMTIVDPVGTGSDMTVRYTITNPSPTEAMTDIEFFDELTDGSGFEPPSFNGFLPFPVNATLPPDPCGAGSSLGFTFPGSGRQGLQLNGGSLAAGASCTYDVAITIPVGFPGGTYVNTTEEISGTVGGVSAAGAGASDDVVIVAPPRLTKEFAEGSFLPGDDVNLRFTLERQGEGTPDATDIAFTDDLNAALAGLTATSIVGTTCAGAAVDITDPTTIAVSGASLSAGDSCTIDVTARVPAGAADGTYTNTTSEVEATVLGTSALGNPASAVLTVTSLVFTKEFLENPYIAGSAGTLRFTFDNQGATDTDITFFTDSLNAVITGLTATGASTSDTCGGSLVGTTFLTYVGGNVAAESSCIVDVPILVPAGAANDTYTNVTSTLTHSRGTSPAAVAPLVVDSTLVQLTAEFTDDPVVPGDDVTLEFELTNLSATETVTDIAFSDNLDAALAGLEATGATANTCSGMATLAFPTSLFDYQGASLAPGASCTIVLTVSVPSGPVVGTTFTNTTSSVSGLVGPLPVTGTPASDDLTLQFQTLEVSFDGPTGATGTADLTFTITNLDATNPISGLRLANNLDAVISGLVATSLPATPCGSRSTIAGTSTLVLDGGSLAAGESCSFTVTVLVPASATPGTYPNTTSALTADGLAVAGAATASLVIEPPPVFAKSFTPDTVLTESPSTLTFSIDNTASSVAATGLAFTDNLPAGLAVATQPNVTTTCTGGTITAAAGSNTISVSGATVAAGATCTISADVSAATDDTYVNTTGDLTSSLGNSGTASDTLTVTPRTPPTVTIDQAVGQADPTRSAPIEFTVVFSEAVAGFNAGALAVVNGTVASVTPAGGNTYTVAVTPTADGIVSATVPADAVGDLEATGNLASTSTDNTVYYDTTSPVIAAGADVQQVTGTGAAAIVSFPTPTATDNSGSATVTCAPASGSTFDVGVTTVTCTAADAAGNTAATSFNVTVVSNAVLPATGGGLDGFTMAMQFLLAGLGLVAFSRLRGRKRLAAN